MTNRERDLAEMAELTGINTRILLAYVAKLEAVIKITADGRDMDELWARAKEDAAQ